MTAKAVLGPLRLPFLVLTPVCVLVGVATAVREIGAPPVLPACLALLGALMAHVSVNAFNEYFDFRSGLDLVTRRTPFSGGSGTLPAHPELAPFALAVATVSLAITIGIGLYFVAQRGLLLLPVGLLGVVLVVTYTTWLTKSPLLCLVAPGLGFGPLMVVGTNTVLTGHYSALAALASLVPGFLASGLLLLNQFPDAEADRSVGRRHAVIAWGPRRAARLFAGLLGGVYAAALALGMFGGAVWGGAAVALSAPVAWKLAGGVFAGAGSVRALLPCMRLNVLLCLGVPMLLSAGLWLG